MDRSSLNSRASYPVWQEVVSRWSDNDVYGHVNNTVFYSWFDTVVNRWLIENGLLDIERGTVIGLVVQSSCRYASSLAYPGRAEIGLALERLGTSSVTYRLGAFAAGAEEAAAEGSFTHVYVDRATRRPRPLAEDWRVKLISLALS